MFKVLEQLGGEVRFLGVSVRVLEQGSCLYECLGGICNGSVSLGMFSSAAAIHGLTVQYPVLSIKKIMNCSVCVLNTWTIQHGLHLEIQLCDS